VLKSWSREVRMTRGEPSVPQEQPFVVYFPTFRFDRLFLAFAAARMRDVAKCG
jgi:hypothetical protein